MKKVTSIVLNDFTNDSRVLKESISLKNNKYKVQVVALYNETLNENEIIEDIPVHRIKLTTRNWSKNRFVQIIKYLEFVVKVIKKYKQSDIFHCNDINTLPIGVMVKIFFNNNVKIVYDAHEYETEMNGLNGIQKKLVKWLEKTLIKYADNVITVSDSIANEYVRLYNIEKPMLVLNTPKYQEIEKKNLFRDKFKIKENQKIFLYQGGLFKGRGIEKILETFKKIENLNVVIIFMGYGPLDEIIRETSVKYKNIYLHNAVNQDLLLDYTSSADFGISLIQDTCLSYRYCLPNKMFEYIMAELPVIVSDLPEMKKIVEENQIGIVTENDSLLLSIENIIKLDEEELNKNLKKVKTVYNWANQESNLIRIYNEL